MDGLGTIQVLRHQRGGWVGLKKSLSKKQQQWFYAFFRQVIYFSTSIFLIIELDRKREGFANKPFCVTIAMDASQP